MRQAAASNPAEPAICVVMPVYNNAMTVAALVGRVVEEGFTPVVVDDGSTDSTAQELTGINAPHIVTHEKNEGKGTALLSGFEKARSLGFSHVVTMDADGQHSPEDLSKLASEIRKDPSAIVIGARRLVGLGRPLKSRVLRAHSNFWAWTQTGKWVSDTQSGLRGYPLDAVLEIDLTRKRYDFETEVLIKAMWAGTAVRTVDVAASYGQGSGSHFRPVADFLRVAKLNAVLFLQAMFLPVEFRREMHRAGDAGLEGLARMRRVARAVILQDRSGPAVLAASLGVGICFGILPIWGLQMIAAAVVAHRFGLSKAVVLTASNISIPAIMPIILYASIVTGRLVLHGRLDATIDVTGLDVEAAWQYAREYAVGSVVLAVVAGVAAWVLTWVVWFSCGRLRRVF